jgi:hypothetical protein
MSSSRSLRCTPVPLVLLAALVAVLALLLGGSPAVADRHGRPWARPGARRPTAPGLHDQQPDAGAADHRRAGAGAPGRAVVEAPELIARGESGQHESMDADRQVRAPPWPVPPTHP